MSKKFKSKMNIKMTKSFKPKYNKTLIKDYFFISFIIIIYSLSSQSQIGCSNSKNNILTFNKNSNIGDNNYNASNNKPLNSYSQKLHKNDKEIIDFFPEEKESIIISVSGELYSISKDNNVHILKNWKFDSHNWTQSKSLVSINSDYNTEIINYKSDYVDIYNSLNDNDTVILIEKNTSLNKIVEVKIKNQSIKLVIINNTNNINENKYTSTLDAIFDLHDSDILHILTKTNKNKLVIIQYKISDNNIIEEYNVSNSCVDSYIGKNGNNFILRLLITENSLIVSCYKDNSDFLIYETISLNFKENSSYKIRTKTKDTKSIQIGNKEYLLSVSDIYSSKVIDLKSFNISDLIVDNGINITKRSIVFDSIQDIKLLYIKNGILVFNNNILYDSSLFIDLQIPCSFQCDSYNNKICDQQMNKCICKEKYTGDNCNFFIPDSNKSNVNTDSVDNARIINNTELSQYSESLLSLKSLTYKSSKRKNYKKTEEFNTSSFLKAANSNKKDKDYYGIKLKKDITVNGKNYTVLKTTNEYNLDDNDEESYENEDGGITIVKNGKVYKETNDCKYDCHNNGKCFNSTCFCNQEYTTKYCSKTVEKKQKEDYIIVDYIMYYAFTFLFGTLVVIVILLIVKK